MKHKKTTGAILTAAIALCLCVTVVFAATGDKKETVGVNESVEWHWPAGENNQVTATYGIRIHPLTKEEILNDHVTIKTKENVLAARSGRVMAVYYDEFYGNVVEIDHGNGYITKYGHLFKVIAQVGQQVDGGVIIGRAGRTGFATGDSLAFWVLKKGISIDPLSFYDFKEQNQSDTKHNLEITTDQMFADSNLIQYYAYMNMREVDATVRPLIEAARKYIINQYTWVADDLSAVVEDENGNVLYQAPKFHDIFPEDWEIPLVK